MHLPAVCSSRRLPGCDMQANTQELKTGTERLHRYTQETLLISGVVWTLGPLIGLVCLAILVL